MVGIRKPGQAKTVRHVTAVDFSHKLSRPIGSCSGSKVRLESLADAAQLIADLQSFPSRPVWCKVASQLLRAAASGKKTDVEAATRMLEAALRTENLLT
jgi:hypothetical protein